MPDLPPYVEATQHLPVRAFVRGFQRDAVVLGWRGERVYVTWRTDMGNHLGRVPAAPTSSGHRPVNDDGTAGVPGAAVPSRTLIAGGTRRAAPVRPWTRVVATL